MAKQPTSQQNVADERDTPAERAQPDFLRGYEASTPDSATSPNYPGNQPWGGPGVNAVAYKAHWKPKPILYPYGTNEEGGV